MTTRGYFVQTGAVTACATFVSRYLNGHDNTVPAITREIHECIRRCLHEGLEQMTWKGIHIKVDSTRDENEMAYVELFVDPQVGARMPMREYTLEGKRAVKPSVPKLRVVK